jgi:steroid 5-alpha reductase family enzyme
MIQIFSIAGITIFLFMGLMYVIAQSIKNNSIVDIGWGIGFVITTFALILSSVKLSPAMVIISFMILIWGMRLSFSIFLRNAGKPEDFRYANWRKEWGKRQPWIAFFKVFMLQGTLMWIIALPVLLVFSSNTHYPGPAALFSIFIFLTGLFTEGFADAQLKRFKLNPENKGKIITTGLWKYSRHPNYFGEAILWWGLGLYGLGVSGQLFSLISPLVITLLLRFVSGVPMLEEKYKNREDFRKYASETPVFIPFFGRKGIT